jgi:hypothetical protein
LTTNQKIITASAGCARGNALAVNGEREATPRPREPRQGLGRRAQGAEAAPGAGGRAGAAPGAAPGEQGAGAARRRGQGGGRGGRRARAGGRGRCRGPGRGRGALREQGKGRARAGEEEEEGEEERERGEGEGSSPRGPNSGDRRLQFLGHHGERDVEEGEGGC